MSKRQNELWTIHFCRVFEERLNQLRKVEEERLQSQQILSNAVSAILVLAFRKVFRISIFVNGL